MSNGEERDAEFNTTAEFRTGTDYTGDGRSLRSFFVSIGEEDATEYHFTSENGFQIAAAILATVIQSTIPHQFEDAESLRDTIAERIAEALIADIASQVKASLEKLGAMSRRHFEN